MPQAASSRIPHPTVTEHFQGLLGYVAIYPILCPSLRMLDDPQFPLIVTCPVHRNPDDDGVERHQLFRVSEGNPPRLRSRRWRQAPNARAAVRQPAGKDRGGWRVGFGSASVGVMYLSCL